MAKPPSRTPEPQAVATAVLAAKRYRYLSPRFVERIARDACRHAKRPKDAEDEVRRRLHQVFGAYVRDLPIERFVSELEETRADPGAQRAAALRLMGAHASTRERLRVLDAFYPTIFQVTGTPRRVLDLACGFGPLALPWMRLEPGAEYHACDVDARYVTLARTCLSVFGVGGSARLCDIAAEVPVEATDVALLLKTVPCLEQQAAGSARHLVHAIDARYVVVSFPTASLGGTGKGMVPTYRATMQRLCEGHDWSVTELLFPVELVFVVDKQRG